MNKRIKQFITKCYNKEKDNYCWINTNKKLSDAELSDIEKYFNNKNYNFMLIINGCSELRPQRTWGALPTFLKGTDDMFNHECLSHIGQQEEPLKNDEFKLTFKK